MNKLTLYEYKGEYTVGNPNLIRSIVFNANSEDEIAIKLVSVEQSYQEEFNTTLDYRMGLLIPQIDHDPNLQSSIYKLFLASVLEEALNGDRKCLAYVLSNLSFVQESINYDFYACVLNSCLFQSSGGHISNLEINDRGMQVKLFAYHHDDLESVVEEVVISKPVTPYTYKKLFVCYNGFVWDEKGEKIGFIQGESKSWFHLYALVLDRRPRIIKLG